MEAPTIQLILIGITGLVVAGTGSFGPSMAHYGKLHRANLQAAAKDGCKIDGETQATSPGYSHTEIFTKSLGNLGRALGTQQNDRPAPAILQGNSLATAAQEALKPAAN